jgi:hypothetical protein
MSEAHESQAADFESEFEAAREAEAADGGALAGQDTDQATGDAGDGDGGQPAGEGEADKVTKRLRDTQRALKAERKGRQELERRLAALEKKGSDGPPDPAALLAALRDDDEDPINDIASLKKLAKALVGQTEAERVAEAQNTQRTQALSTISSTMKEYEDDFRELTPDYDKAARHFMDARMEELKDTGLDGQALAVAMQNDFAGIVTRSIQAGKDPAEIIYNMALRRGFKSGAASAKLDTIQRGQAQAKTLNGGGAATGLLSAGKVAELSGAAFDAAFEKLRASERRR